MPTESAIFDREFLDSRPVEVTRASFRLAYSAVLCRACVFRETTWQKVTTTYSNGASSSSVYGALLSSVLAVVGLFALNF